MDMENDLLKQFNLPYWDEFRRLQQNDTLWQYKFPRVDWPNPTANLREMANNQNLTLSLNFDGRFLLLRIVKDDEIIRLSYRAVSGRPGKNGEFDYSIERQAEIDVGPIPEGSYYINPQEIQYANDRSAWDKFKGEFRGGSFRGGEPSWGIGRVWIDPRQVVINGVTRSNFSIHGGSEPGSQGCIDLVDNDKSFFARLVEYRGHITYIPLTVKYSK